MELIDQHTKRIMEGCKQRARDAGLRFQDDSLEYVVTNRDLIELSPKVMIPTLYDYWVHDVEVLKGRGEYELYPGNPYETVINTRPAISFYNDNNPDWLNVMIFYHVLGHIDFFQNNLFFRHTWDYDFSGEALSDKRMIATLRSTKGRWVDYVIEFARAIDNLVAYHEEVSRLNRAPSATGSKMVDYYFDVFLQNHLKVTVTEYIKELERFNAAVREHGELGEERFFRAVDHRHPEFKALYEKSLQRRGGNHLDLMDYLMSHSPFLNREENVWMQSVIQMIRKTSLFFQPQVRTKIMNEGWASYWHETLFMQDDRIRGHEVEYARVNAGVTAMPKVGLNPYALGMRLLYYVEEMADKGRYEFAFDRLRDAETRKRYDAHTGRGREAIFKLRENLDDFQFINTYVDQDFMDRHNLFVAGKRVNQARMTWEYYIKSRKARDYRQMIINTLYHPPCVRIDPEKTANGLLYLDHRFEGKPLVRDYIHAVLMGIEYLWGGKVQLETAEVKEIQQPAPADQRDAPPPMEIKWQRVLYTMEKRKMVRRVLYDMEA